MRSYIFLKYSVNKQIQRHTAKIFDEMHVVFVLFFAQIKEKRYVDFVCAFKLNNLKSATKQLVAF